MHSKCNYVLDQYGFTFKKNFNFFLDQFGSVLYIRKVIFKLSFLTLSEKYCEAFADPN